MFLAAILMVLCAKAATNFNVVSIHLNDNTHVDLMINDQLKMSFTETHLTVEGAETEVSFERSKLAKFTHSYKADSGIEAVKGDGQVDVKGDKIMFYGLPAGTSVDVYNLGGVNVKSVVAEGDYELNLNGLSSGVYVVRAQGNSFKVTVK